jgi:hypothetical protein
MSAVLEVTIYCDAVDPISGVSCGDAIEYEGSVADARRQARDDGWSSGAGRDRCSRCTRLRWPYMEREPAQAVEGSEE